MVKRVLEVADDADDYLLRREARRKAFKPGHLEQLTDDPILWKTSTRKRGLEVADVNNESDDFLLRREARRKAFTARREIAGSVESAQDLSSQSTGSPSAWYRVTIPCGKRYQRDWVLTALQDVWAVEFTPVQYRVLHNRVQFFVNDPSGATASQIYSCTITDADCRKLAVCVAGSVPPPSPKRPDPRPGHLEQLKDDHGLPPPTADDVETPTTTPSCKDSADVSEKIEGLFLQFVHLLSITN